MTDVWRCRSGLDAWALTLTFGSGGLNLDVTGMSVLGVTGMSVVPEPSTWAMLSTGFLGLGWLGLRGRRRSLVA